MTTTIVAVFFLVYLGMILGGLPFVQLDRTGVALLGAIVLIAVEADQPLPLFVATLVLSNVVSNVPAVMLLLHVAKQPSAGPLLALVSTLAGNLVIVGSIANTIVVDAAARHGVRIDWRTHARIGVPVAFSTLAIAAACLALGR